MTVGAGSNTGKYRTDGRRIELLTVWTFGAGAAVSADAKINLPFTPVASSGYSGTASYFDSSTSELFFGNIRLDGYFKYYAVSGTHIALGYLTPGAPFTWDEGDVISLEFTSFF